jgi:parallel beta-helix repeat protein
MRLIGVNTRTMSILLSFAIWAWVAGVIAPAGAAPTTVNCNKVVSPSGVDGGPGSVSAPWKTVTYAVEHLNSGETGCLRNGTYAFSEVVFRRPSVTLSSYPGERATMRGTVKVEIGADDVTVSNLDLNGSGGASNIGPFVFANDTTFENDDVTNEHTDICFMIGSHSSSAGPATDTLIADNRIHDCGSTPSRNQDHGIYVGKSDGLVVRQNWIYDNTDRGVQLYPEAMDSEVYENVITENGEGVIVSDASSGNVIRNNVITNSKIRWNIETSNLYGSGNVVKENCVWASNSSQGSYYQQNGGIQPANEHGPGLTSVENTVTAPQFASASTSDFTTESPCLSDTEAPATTPVGTETTAPTPPTEVNVTLQPGSGQATEGKPVTLVGKVSGGEAAADGAPASTPVTIQVMKNGKWHKVGKAKVKQNGKFKIRKKLGRKVTGGKKAHLRAKLAQYGRSRAVTIRFKS